MKGAAWRAWVLQNEKAAIVLWPTLMAVFSLINMVLEVSKGGKREVQGLRIL
jgi:hypothetical protein